MAPELVMQCYDEKADLWSVGMLAYQLLTGRFPFWEDVRNETLSDVWKVWRVLLDLGGRGGQHHQLRVCELMHDQDKEHRKQVGVRAVPVLAGAAHTVTTSGRVMQQRL